MKITWIFFSFAFMLISSCSSDAEEKGIEDETIKIIGSDTELKMVEELTKSYSKITGEVFDVSGEGTSIGIEALINGSAHIANCSRPMFYDEVEAARANGIDPVPVVIAIDAIALISHPKNHVDSLSTLQLEGIFSGEIDNWSELGGLDRPINFYGRNEKSGTYKILEDRFVRFEGFSYKMKEMGSNQEVLDAVMADTFAIGYVGAGLLMDEEGRPNPDIWAMYLYTEGDHAAYSPYETRAVIDGDYPLVRPLYQYFDGIPAGRIAEFLKFELSDQGQKIIGDLGYFPLTSKYQSENERNGIAF